MGAFVPPPPTAWEGPASSASGGFTPPPPESWQGEGKTPKPEPAKGFWSSLGTGLGNYAKGVAKTALPVDFDEASNAFRAASQGQYGEAAASAGKSIIQGTPVGKLAKMAHDTGKSAADESKKSYEYAQAGRPSEAVGHAAAAALPLVGPMAANWAEQAGGEPPMPQVNQVGPQRERDIAGAIGSAAGDLGPALITGGVMKSKLPEVVSRGVKDYLDKGNPQAQMTQAAKARRPLDLERALPEVKASEQELGRPTENIDHALEDIRHAKQRVWAQRDQILGPKREMGSMVDLSHIADAMEAAIPGKLKLENPAAAQQMYDAAQVYRNKFPLPKVEEFLKNTNAELGAYYGKNPAARRTGANGNPDTAALVAQADGFRTGIDSVLEQGSGAARETGKRYGALLQLEDALERRKPVSERQQPDSLSEQIGKWSGYGQIARGIPRIFKDPIGGLADIGQGLAMREAAKYLKESQTTNNLIRRSLKNQTGLPSDIPIPVQAQVKGLLEPGPIRMSSGPDQSGPIPPTLPNGIRVQPPDANGAIKNWQPRSLPSATIPPSRQLDRGSLKTPPPADASGIKVSSAMPVVDPETGEIKSYTSESATPTNKMRVAAPTPEQAVRPFPANHLEAFAKANGISPLEAKKHLAAEGWQVQ